MAPRTPIAALAALAALALLLGCGSEKVDANAYTCGEFKESFRDKDDTSAGNFIRQLSDKVKKRPGADKEAREQQIGAAVALVCGGKPEDFKPAPAAITLVDQANSGKLPKSTGTTETEKPETTTDDDTSAEPETTEEETTEEETTTTEP